MTDTIFALSSGRPPAGIAVIRVSGPRAFAAGEALAGPLPEPRRAVVRAFRDPASGELLDRGLLLVFPGPQTATGENIVEFQCHGGKATIDALLTALDSVEGLRVATGGEFTRQALANGIIDLSAAEGLADLLAAETEWQRRVALRRNEGAVRRTVEEIRDSLLALAAAVELAIDYVDEDDGATMSVPDEAFASLAGNIGKVLNEPTVERLRDGVRVVVAGPPNAGKSSLVNVLAREERVIVTPVAGTTRDTVEVTLSLGGLPVVLVDTAGLRETGDEVERLGIERAEREAKTADILLWLGDANSSPPGAIRVAAKADLGSACEGLRFSSVTDIGHVELVEAITARARELIPHERALALTKREREAFQSVLAHVDAAAATEMLEVRAHHLRLALEQLDLVTGRAGVEDLLDSLFSRFCVGK